MKKIFNIVLMGVAVMAATSCSKLGALSADNFKVTPTPLEANAGVVQATINGTFPEKYMKTNAVVTVTPVLKYEGGEAVAASQTFQGEKVLGNDQTISYKMGGNYTMRSQWQYTPEMMQSDLYLRFTAKIGNKEQEVPEVKVGYGVVSTSDLLSRTLASTNGAVAPDAFQRVIAQKQEGNIKFLINQAQLRQSELQSTSVKDFIAMLKDINADQERLALDGIEVSAYASPDGGYAFNEKLAEKRQNTTTDYLKKQMKNIGMDNQVDAKYTAEDWDGFQQLVAASNIQDKDVILRVLSMYQDPEEREQQIHSMSSVFTELADGILPELRRARLTINYQVIGRDDEQILAQYKEDPKELSLEELLYGANMLVENNADRAAWNNTIVSLYPNDYRAYNNLASLAYANGDLAGMQSALDKAAALKGDAAEVNTNRALMALAKGDYTTAQTYIGRGTAADSYNEVLGNLNIATGNYAAAASALKDKNTNSTALAQILSKDYSSAAKTLSNIKNGDATTDYLSAILSARTNDAAGVASNLTKAISKDRSYLDRAKKDLEFVQYASTLNILK
ncbi:MAG: hypothetical protein HUK00_04775 [Bacteroidaceae bacterium]|nr:hypothetical protein [Bacteroidaceae bacterium]